MRVNVGNKDRRWFRYKCREWRDCAIAARNREAVKTDQHMMLRVPETRHRAHTSYKSKYGNGSNVGNRDVSHRTTKRLEGALFRAEPHTHRLLVGNHACPN